MPFANGPETENEAQAAFRRARLVRMRHDAGIEQCRGLERIFVQEIGPDQLALDAGKSAVSRQRLFHLVGAELEFLQQVAMPALKVLQYVCQQAGCDFRIECQNTLDDVVGAGLVGRVEIARFGRRLEGAYDHARGIGTQIERLPMQESGLRQDVLGSLERETGTQAPMARSATGGVTLTLTRAS